MPRKKQHYVDNEKFLEVMTEYRNAYLDGKENGEVQKPMIPDYAGECFLKIADRLSHRPNFINYAFREEMVSDGIENSVMYASNFNPEKSKNPFAYFTQITYYAFLRRIEKEKKQLYIKYKTMDEFSSLEDSSDMTSLGSDKGAVSAGASPLSSDKRASIHEFIATFEEKKRAKKKVKVVTKKDDTLIALSPLTSYINQAYA